MKANRPEKAIPGVSGARQNAPRESKQEAVSSDLNRRPQSPQPRQPVDVVDGVPDRSSRPAAWRYIALAIIFLAWLGFLIYCLLAGRIAH